MLKRLLAPEVVQTSSLDCGPAALKCLLEGFGIRASYGRLREACQTGLDGTSIDTMEEVANQLGLEAEQIMLPVDHLFLPEAKALPAIVVVTLPNGVTHFVVVWRRYGNLLQLMDPAVGRRWTTTDRFSEEVYRHRMPVSAADWREFAASPDFQIPLEARLRGLGLGKAASQKLTRQALASDGWRELASLDASARLMCSLQRAGGLPPRHRRAALLERFSNQPELIPAECWLAASIPENQEHVLLQGAVLVRARKKRPGLASEKISGDLAQVEEREPSPAFALLRLLRGGGVGAACLLIIALAVAAGGTLIEALLFRGLFDVNSQLKLSGQRGGALAALLLFSFALLLLEVPAFATGVRLGRRIENRLRVLFLEKIPRLSDRYFQSRLTSDMAERSHLAHRLRRLPDQVRQLLSALAQLAATAAGIIWLEPQATPLVLLACAAAVLPTFAAQAPLAERDLRMRTHAAGLTRFYLDAMLGLTAIRAHGAERNVRHEQEKLLGQWAQAAWRFQRAIVSLEAIQLIATFGLIVWLLLARPIEGSEAGRILLLAYWALNLPVLGRDIGIVARQFPAYRNLTLRLLEPLGAPDEAAPESQQIPFDTPPTIEFRSVSVEASGHTILSKVDLAIKAASHVAIVGPSGAGKSSLVGILLGWLKPNEGGVWIDGEPLDYARLRASTAWVDPAVQLWNRSLLTNLTYGGSDNAPPVAEAIDTAMLHGVLESLPEGLQTKLGEGGGLVSGGEGQRARFGRALARRGAPLVILDEPFRGLDREKRRELLARAREVWRGATMLCITHDLAETQTFDQVVVVEGGRAVEHGSPSELASNTSSRYSQLLAAEERTRSALWSAAIWRRIRIHSGQLVEELPPAESENSRASEVA